MAGIEEERKKQRNRYLLLILAAVGVIYLLWAVSLLFAPDRTEAETPAPPGDGPARLGADLDLAEKLIAKDRRSEALRYLNNVRDALELSPSEGLRPAQALELSMIRQRLSGLEARLDELDNPDAAVKGTRRAAPSGIQ